MLRDFPKDSTKNLPLFASILYIGNRELFLALLATSSVICCFAIGIVATLAELRVVGNRPKPSIMLKSPRPKMYRSTSLRPDQIDDLYSELTCVAW